MTETASGQELVDKRAILARHYLFCDLEDAVIDRIAALGVTTRLGAGQLLFRKGDEGNALFGVLDGKVRISTRAPNGREVIISVFEPGDIFGEIALLDGLPRAMKGLARVNHIPIPIPIMVTASTRPATRNILP